MEIQGQNTGPAEKPAEALRKKVVLAVDDELVLTRVIKICLEDGDKRLRVDCASSGNEAIRIIEGGNVPDAILSDLNMPDGTGEELYRWLEKHS